MGAGDAGELIVREMRANPHQGLEPVGFLDDDPGKHNVRIHGVPVLGDRHAIPEVARQYKVKQVIIALPTAAGGTVREIVAICIAADLKTRIIPAIYEILDGTVSVSHLRDVRIEDLLRREPVHTDRQAVATLLRGKRVLVTGSGGSIGSELCRQILRCEPAELVLVGHGENSIYDIYNELRVSDSEIVPIIADIRHPDRLRAVFERYRPEIVFHAAVLPSVASTCR